MLKTGVAQCAVYRKRGYVDLVSDAVERSMRAAIEEVKSLPDYQEKGEVIECISLPIFSTMLSSINSGFSLMQGTAPVQMRTPRRYRASLECNFGPL